MKTAVVVLFTVVSCFAYTFNASLTFSNTTNSPITFQIVRGDLFEATDQGSFVQNATATHDMNITIPGRSTITVDIEMACIDPDRPAPEAYHQIRPTMFRMPGRPDPSDIHQRLRDAANNYRHS